MTSTGENARLLDEFTEWARERRLSAHPHDAQFHGLVGGTPVEIETGIRDGGLEVVVVTIFLACGLGAKVLRDARDDPDDTALVAGLRAVLRRPSMLGIRLDDAMITLRMKPGSRPTEVGEGIDAVLAAVIASVAGPRRDR